jgi:hypothetical protein
LLARITIDEALSRMTCLGTPPKKRHAASSPAHTSSTVCVNVGHTCMYRLDDSVTISAHSRRGFLSASVTVPINPKSICASCPAGGSSRRTVGACFRQPSSRLVNRRSVV